MAHFWVRRLSGTVMASLVAGACCLLAPGSAEAATHARTSAQSGRTTQLPVAGPVIHPVRGAPIRDLPLATPAALAATPPVPDQPFVGLVDPHGGSSHMPEHAVMVPPASGPSVIQAAGVSSVFNGQSQPSQTDGPSDSSSACGPLNDLEQLNRLPSVYT